MENEQQSLLQLQQTQHLEQLMENSRKVQAEFDLTQQKVLELQNELQAQRSQLQFQNEQIIQNIDLQNTKMEYETLRSQIESLKGTLDSSKAKQEEVDLEVLLKLISFRRFGSMIRPNLQRKNILPI